MQPTYICSFRARLAKRGYKNINIYQAFTKDRKDLYYVSAIEPLAGFGVSTILSTEEIFRLFR